MAKGLTPRQQAILQFVAEYVQDKGFPPSIREIGEHFQIGSLRGVTVHLDALQKKGFIDRQNTPRSIRVKHPTYQPASNQVAMLPLVGTIAAGAPILAEQYIEDMYPVPAQMVRNIKEAFLLRVKGESMTGEGIRPRDLVVIRRQPTANHGDLVAVLVDEEATVKRIHFSGETVRLMPANPAYEPLEVHRDNAQIIGRVIGLLRDYDNMAF